MGELVKKVVSVLGFIVGIAVVRHGLDAVLKPDPSTKVKEAYEQLKTDAEANHPESLPPLAMQQEAKIKTEAALGAAQDETKRLQTAVGTFMGFYLVNTRTRVDFCRDQGVDIQPFIAAFEAEHSQELQKARAVLAKNGTDENQIYSITKPQLTDVLAKDMNLIASSNKTSVKGACELVAANGETLAADMHIAKVIPAVYKILSESNNL